MPSCDPAEYTIGTVPERFARIGDPHAGIDAQAGSLDSLLELSARQELADVIAYLMTLKGVTPE